MRILVAEDDQGLQSIIALGLREAGYQVDTVERGDDAIDQMKWYEYDVAVVDWRMPGAEGIDVVAWVRRNKRPTALLMLTARDAACGPCGAGHEVWRVRSSRGAASRSTHSAAR